MLSVRTREVPDPTSTPGLRSVRIAGLRGTERTRAAIRLRPPGSCWLFLGIAGPAAASILGLGSLRASPLNLPNASFESPPTAFVNPQVDSWQKTPKPFWYDESSGYLWSQLTGAFVNTAAGSADHIDNVDGNQAAFLFAVPEVGLFQDYDSIGGTNLTPVHAFEAIFQTGKAYSLSVGVIGGGGGMTNGASLQIGLYYRDAAGAQVTLVATNVTYSPADFPTTTHFVDVISAIRAI